MLVLVSLRQARQRQKGEGTEADHQVHENNIRPVSHYATTPRRLRFFMFNLRTRLEARAVFVRDTTWATRSRAKWSAVRYVLAVIIVLSSFFVGVCVWVRRLGIGTAPM